MGRLRVAVRGGVQGVCGPSEDTDVTFVGEAAGGRGRGRSYTTLVRLSLTGGEQVGRVSGSQGEVRATTNSPV